MDDRTLVLADVAEKALRRMKQVVRDLLAERMGQEKADSLGRSSQAAERPVRAASNTAGQQSVPASPAFLIPQGIPNRLVCLEAQQGIPSSDEI
ncbi:MAG: hypothetical protein ABI649_01395 [Gaiellaceae bacterium]